MEIPGGDRYYAANAGNADAVESRLREAGSDYILIESDISNEKAVKDIYAKAIERFGRVDILVNNAAADDENGLRLFGGAAICSTNAK